MRWRMVVGTLFAVTSMAATARAQEGGTLDYGGVPLPVPAQDRATPDTLSPSQFRATEAGPTHVEGRQGGREVVGADGEVTTVYQSTRISSVTTAGDNDERYDWFYPAYDIYTGIIPSERDTLPHIGVHQRRGATGHVRVTWIGFQPFDDFTRVFVQTSRQPTYTINEYTDENGSVVELLLDNSRLSLSNFFRLIDTTYFDRSVQFIDAENAPNSRARVVVFLDGEPNYTVTASDDYVYLDFQDGASAE